MTAAHWIGSLVPVAAALLAALVEVVATTGCNAARRHS